MLNMFLIGATSLFSLIIKLIKGATKRFLDFGQLTVGINLRRHRKQCFHVRASFYGHFTFKKKGNKSKIKCPSTFTPSFEWRL